MGKNFFNSDPNPVLFSGISSGSGQIEPGFTTLAATKQNLINNSGGLAGIEPKGMVRPKCLNGMVPAGI